MQEEYKYKAFISYSHKDEKFAKWLHKKLEDYKIPKDLYEKYPNLPKKLYPIFRDIEELPTSSSLSQNIIDALKDSAYLIVICSPNSAKSQWVNKEIIDFKTIHKDGEDRVLPIILSGEPNAKDRDDLDDNLECFPEALKYKVKNGKLTNERTEPIAADVREGMFDKEFGKLKLIAGLLGVDFEELNQREIKKQKQRKILWGSIATILITIFATLSLYSYKQKNIALENKQVALKNEEKAKIRLFNSLFQQGYTARDYLNQSLKAKHFFTNAISESVNKNQFELAKPLVSLTNPIELKHYFNLYNNHSEFNKTMLSLSQAGQNRLKFLKEYKNKENIFLSKDSSKVLIVKNKQIIIKSAKTGKILNTIAFKRSIEHITYNNDMTKIIVVFMNKKTESESIQLYDIINKKVLLKKHYSNLHSDMFFSKDGFYVIEINNQNEKKAYINIYKTKDGHLYKSINLSQYEKIKLFPPYFLIYTNEIDFFDNRISVVLNPNASENSKVLVLDLEEKSSFFYENKCKDQVTTISKNKIFSFQECGNHNTIINRWESKVLYSSVSFVDKKEINVYDYNIKDISFENEILSYITDDYLYWNHFKFYHKNIKSFFYDKNKGEEKIVTISKDNSVKIWKLKYNILNKHKYIKQYNLNKVTTFDDKTSRENTLYYNYEKNKGKVEIHNIKTQKKILTFFHSKTYEEQTLHISDKFKYIISEASMLSASDREVIIFDIKSKREVFRKTFKNKYAIGSLILGKYLIYEDTDRNIFYLLNIKNHKVKKVKYIYKSESNDIISKPLQRFVQINKNYYIGFLVDGNVIFLNSKELKIYNKFPFSIEEDNIKFLDNNSKLLLSYKKDYFSKNNYYLYDINTSKLLFNIKANEFILNGNIVIYIQKDKNRYIIKKFNLKNKKTTLITKIEGKEFNFVKIEKDLLVVSVEQNIKFLDLGNNKELLSTKFERYIDELGYSYDFKSKRIVVNNEIWDINKKSIIKSNKDSICIPSNYKFSSDGKQYLCSNIIMDEGVYGPTIETGSLYNKNKFTIKLYDLTDKFYFCNQDKWICIKSKVGMSIWDIQSKKNILPRKFGLFDVNISKLVNYSLAKKDYVLKTQIDTGTKMTEEGAINELNYDNWMELKNIYKQSKK